MPSNYLSEQEAELMTFTMRNLLQWAATHPEIGLEDMGMHADSSDMFDLSCRVLGNEEHIETFCQDMEDLGDIFDMTPEHIELARSWKNAHVSKFLLERYLKKGAMLIDMESSDENDIPDVYVVQGINHSMEDAFAGTKPLMMEAILVPFKDRIVYTGIVNMHPISFGPGIRKSFKDWYMSAKNAGRIYSSLPKKND